VVVEALVVTALAVLKILLVWGLSIVFFGVMGCWVGCCFLKLDSAFRR
jgi:hypothetical protein